MVKFKNSISGKIMMVADSRAEEYRQAGYTEVSENPGPVKTVVEEPETVVVKKAPTRKAATKTTKKK